MKLELQRYAARDTYTIGRLLVDGVKLCDVLEPPIALPDGRQNVQRRTAVPAGTYAVVVNVSARFRRMLPRLLGVPGRDGILIHRGNTAADTSGCILPGENRIVGRVVNSTHYEQAITAALRDAQERGYDITITVTNPWGWDKKHPAR